MKKYTKHSIVITFVFGLLYTPKIKAQSNGLTNRLPEILKTATLLVIKDDTSDLNWNYGKAKPIVQSQINDMMEQNITLENEMKEYPFSYQVCFKNQIDSMVASDTNKIYYLLIASTTYYSSMLQNNGVSKSGQGFWTRKIELVEKVDFPDRYLIDFSSKGVHGSLKRFFKLLRRIR